MLCSYRFRQLDRIKPNLPCILGNEINGVGSSLLAPHFIGDFAYDFPVLHFKNMGKSDRHFRALGIGKIGHLVPYDREVCNLVIEYELLSREPPQWNERTVNNRSENAAIRFKNILPLIHYDAARRSFPSDLLTIKGDGGFDRLRRFIMKMRLDDADVARDDLIA